MSKKLIVVRAYVLKDVSNWDFQPQPWEELYEPEPIEEPVYVVFDLENEEITYLYEPCYDWKEFTYNYSESSPGGTFEDFGVDEKLINRIKEYDIKELP